MIFIAAMPDEQYFFWQVKVQISNLEKLGFTGQYHVLILSNKNSSSGFLQLMEQVDAEKYKFFFYEDRAAVYYPPAIKPLLLAKHLKNRTLAEFFYIDPDVIFRELPDFKALPLTGCWASDTSSYVGANYLKSKDERLFTDMCAVVGIQPGLVTSRHNDSGGGQYLIRGTDADLWEKVYRDSLTLYRLLENSANYYTLKHPNDYPAQKWCAEMWATLWNLWLVTDCRIHQELSFCWPTDPISYWQQNKILHNAGVTIETSTYLFFKGTYINKLPFYEDFAYVSDDHCSVEYVKALKDAMVENIALSDKSQSN